MTSTVHLRDEPLDILLSGFPGRSDRGFLGWSTVVLLRHADHMILFDTGGPGDRPGLIEGLRARGLEASDINMIVLSHLHFDHALNVELFESANILVHEAELAYAEAFAGKDLALCQWATTAILQHPRLQILSGEPELIPGVRVLHTPGHTGGCISLILNNGGESWILAQDAVKNRLDLANQSVEVAADKAQAIRSLLRLRSLADIIVPGHDVPLRFDGDHVIPQAVATLKIDEVVSGRSVTLVAGTTDS